MGSKIVAPHIPGGAYGKLGLGLVTGIIAGKSKPKSMVGKHLQSAAVGASLIQFTEGLTALLQPIVSGWADNGEPSTLKTYVKKSVGLAAPDSSFYEELLARRGVNDAPITIPATTMVESEAFTDPAGV
ncbi:hypothetical protein [Flagellimonas marina]|uniref:Uncharacterized protein n=1 Tax=Flagellimonas marina TaxID=1775168 RepID=A0ABV8PFR0_9FLAO